MNNKIKEKESHHRYYLKNKEAYIKRAREWDKKHPRKKIKSNKKAVKKFTIEKREQFNQLMMKNYYNNKKKWLERAYVNKHRKEFLELLPKKCSCCGKKIIKIISHINYNVQKRKSHPTREEVKKYLIKYTKLLLPFCSKKCCRKYLKKEFILLPSCSETVETLGIKPSELPYIKKRLKELGEDDNVLEKFTKGIGKPDGFVDSWISEGSAGAYNIIKDELLAKRNQNFCSFCKETKENLSEHIKKHHKEEIKIILRGIDKEEYKRIRKEILLESL